MRHLVDGKSITTVTFSRKDQLLIFTNFLFFFILRVFFLSVPEKLTAIVDKWIVPKNHALHVFFHGVLIEAAGKR